MSESLDLRGRVCWEAQQKICSALYPLVLEFREKILLYKDLFVILDLTKYEIGNVIWKEFKKNKIKDLLTVLQLFKEILSDINELSINKDLDEVEKISIENNMTFYDASYIYIARKHRLKIVTEDKDLLKFKESMDVATLRREIFSHQ